MKIEHVIAILVAFLGSGGLGALWASRYDFKGKQADAGVTLESMFITSNGLVIDNLKEEIKRLSEKVEVLSNEINVVRLEYEDRISDIKNDYDKKLQLKDEEIGHLKRLLIQKDSLINKIQRTKRR